MKSLLHSLKRTRPVKFTALVHEMATKYQRKMIAQRQSGELYDMIMVFGAGER